MPLPPTAFRLATALAAVLASAALVTGAPARAQAPPAAAAAARAAAVNEYPTIERMMFVRECTRTQKAEEGHELEALTKCACVMDRLAETMTFEDFSTLSTLGKSVTIAGERGGTLRENDSLKPALKAWRDARAHADRMCMLGSR